MPIHTDAIAIIGAGPTGAALAHLLEPARKPLRVYEKARGPGGRMSTRRTELGQYNHGAAGFIAEQLDTLPLSLLATLPSPPEAAQFPAAANACVRALLHDAPVEYATRVSTLVREPLQWRLLGDDGRILGHAGTVLITAPAPQAADLLQLEKPSWARELRVIDMCPSWVVLMNMPDHLGSAHLRPPEHVHWKRRPPIAQHPACVVYEAGPEWSRHALEASTEEVIASCLDSLGLDRGMLGEVQAHRWRYAHCMTPLQEDAFWDPQLQLGVAGDAFAGQRSQQGIVRALHSAAALAALCSGGKPCT